MKTDRSRAHEWRWFGVDRHGDSMDVSHGTRREAEAGVAELLDGGECPAVVAEEVGPDGTERRVVVHGDPAALEAGGWAAKQPPPPVPRPPARPVSVPASTSWFAYDDGGRAAAGFRGTARDCVVRAVAIAARLPYKEVYGQVALRARSERRPAGQKRSRPNAGVTVQRKWFKDYMRELGFSWHPTMSIGSGCRVHLRPDELPPGRLVASVSRHYCAVIDGVVHDSHDPTRGGRRCVYGYWLLEGSR